MNTKMIGAGLALAMGVFACAMPAEEPPPAPTDEPTSGEANEELREIRSELRKGGDSCPGAACGTPDGTQKCCCKVGDRCESGGTFCRCVPANVWGGGVYAP